MKSVTYNYRQGLEADGAVHFFGRNGHITVQDDVAYAYLTVKMHRLATSDFSDMQPGPQELMISELDFVPMLKHLEVPSLSVNQRKLQSCKNYVVKHKN